MDDKGESLPLPEGFESVRPNPKPAPNTFASMRPEDDTPRDIPSGEALARSREPLLPPTVKIVNLGGGDEERLRAIERLLEKEAERKQRPVDNEALVRRLAIEIAMPYTEALTAAASRLFKDGRGVKKGFIRPHLESTWTNAGEDGLRRESVVSYTKGKGENGIQVNSYEQAIYFNSPDVPDSRFRIEMEKGHLKKAQLIGAWDIQNADHAFNHIDISPALSEFIRRLNRTEYVHGDGQYRMVELTFPTDFHDSQQLAMAIITEDPQKNMDRKYYGSETGIVFDAQKNYYQARHKYWKGGKSKIPHKKILPQADRTESHDVVKLDFHIYNATSILEITQGFLSLIPTEDVSVRK